MASPSAHGQLMTSTAMAVVNEKNTVWCPAKNQKHPAATAARSTTGTKTPLTRSAKREIGALEFEAFSTS